MIQLQKGKCIKAPGIFDGVSAKVADQMGFSALYMSGYSVSASLLGKPDAGYLTVTHMGDRVRTICGVTQTPIIVDADTGFGGLVNVQETVRIYEAGGAAAIQLEDQQFPKRCGHTKNRTVIDIKEATAKIKMAVQSRTNKDFLIIARTDARTSLGLDEALRRGESFLKAGADVLFIESPESVEELEIIGQTFRDTWLLANMVGEGKTPLLTTEELAALGFNIAIHPVAALMAAAATYKNIYQQLENWEEHPNQLVPFAEFNQLIGFEEIWKLDERLSRKD